MKEGLEGLFLREKPVLALLAVGELNPAYAAAVAKQIDSTFPHTSSILSQLEEQGLITSNHEGRIRYLKLTDRGKKVAFALAGLRDLLRSSGVQWRKAERLKQIVDAQATSGSSLKLGPLRRDIARLKGSGDSEIRRFVESLDECILNAL